LTGFSGLVGMDFLWGEAALKRRRARANEQAQAVDADMDSEENMLEDRKRMFREDLAIDPRRSGLSVLFFPATTQLLMSNAPKNGVKAKVTFF
jgi:nucleolar pre-ribosomal-associated protein 1